MQMFIEIFGWYGAAAILSAYFLNSFGLLKTGFAYQTLNLTGAIGIVVVSMHQQAYPPAGLNTVWALIAGYALIRQRTRSV